jgi:hypothetical protein
MPLAELIQNLIHKLEVGGGARYLRLITLTLAVLALAVLYNSCAYRNISTPEGMDAAQLARNISEGKGYTTLYLRPFSLYLVQRHNQAGGTAALTNTNFDFAQIRTAHPDLANPPVYPAVLAVLMKVLPFHWQVDTQKNFWSEGGRFQRYQPDFLIAVFNQILLLAAMVLVFFLSRKLFDAGVAWLSVVLTIGCELLWRFTTSGLPTLLLLVIFLGLAWCILKIEELAREPQPRLNRLLALVLIAGVLTGVGALTRYAFGWVIFPVMMFLILFSGQRRVLHALAALGAFAVVLAPWIARNYAVSGTPFGTATFAVVGGTFLFPQFQLERSVHPDLSHILWLPAYFQKLLANARGIVEDLPTLGGSWASMLFFAGLLLGFRNKAARRMRYFLLMCLGVFILVQALGQTQHSSEPLAVNSENLLVLLVPLVFIYGVSFFFTLLEQMTLPMIQLRYAIMAVFLGLSCLPMIFALLPPKTNPVVYPPYYPPDIQRVSGWMNENELIMSDVPWAVAWYGQRQCVWLTLDCQDEFSTIDKNMKPVQALYLTPQTMDGKYVSEWMEGGEHSWGNFLFQILNDKRVPDNFPLTHAPTGFFPERMFLTDSDRWKLTSQ